jgi:hypothetical protein
MGVEEERGVYRTPAGPRQAVMMAVLPTLLSIHDVTILAWYMDGRGG